MNGADQALKTSRSAWLVDQNASSSQGISV
jgi:hypothetical protein